MLLNPAIIALLLISWLSSGFAIYAALVGDKIIQSWDLTSGSARQLALERKTYLIAHIFSYLMAVELFSLFLFIYTADNLHPLFVGAMCAAGSLNVNTYGYPALLTKLLSALLCGIWLILNYLDNQAQDYPLIRPKYKFLMVIAGVLLIETYLQTNYFLRLRADVITSCCGTLFSADTPSLAGMLAGLRPFPTQIAFFLAMIVTLRTGIHFLVTGRAAALFGKLSGGMLVLAIVAIISFISLYYYQLPTHHCPFCLLQKGYHFIGYPLYATLLTAGISGISVGVIQRFNGVKSLDGIRTRLQRRLCWIALGGYLLFTAIATYPVLFSNFILTGY
ncbi:MAG: hypothetical protein WBG37_07745 [Desulfobacterales bacterium]